MLPRVLLAATLVAGLAVVPSAHAKTVWLCRPGNAADPCHRSLAATVVSPAGARRGVVRPRPASNAPVDCFYVYPTVSEEPKPQADLAITPSLKAIASFHAAPFRQVCRVWAPVYRQVTLQGLLQPNTVTAAMQEQGYDDVRAAWRDYLAHDNNGRGVVLIGHSQGTFFLRRLLAEVIEPKRSERRLLVSALLLGGNVTVAAGKDTGGDFKSIRACRAATQTGCVVAYSTFNQQPPPNSIFGRALEPGREVLCTNPAALAGGAGKLDAYLPTLPFPGILGQQASLEAGPLPKVSTPWLSVPGAVTARCSSAAGAHVLRVTSPPGGRKFTPEPDATWGLHLSDVSIAQQTLVGLVRRQAAAWSRAAGR